MDPFKGFGFNFVNIIKNCQAFRKTNYSHTRLFFVPSCVLPAPKCLFQQTSSMSKTCFKTCKSPFTSSVISCAAAFLISVQHGAGYFPPVKARQSVPTTRGTTSTTSCQSGQNYLQLAEACALLSHRGHFCLVFIFLDYLNVSSGLTNILKKYKKQQQLGQIFVVQVV